LKAIYLTDFGGPEVLELREWPNPDIRPHDLIVEVRAAGVNRADLSYRKGAYGRANFGDSDLMGLEIAGDVIELGSEVRGFSEGDRVMGIVGGGGYAESARIDYRMAMRIPETLDYVHAAAVPEAFITAHESLFHLGRLDRGESVLIHAAASGVGSAAVQLAHVAGATVYATADETKLDQVRQLGADITIAYKTTDFGRGYRRVPRSRRRCHPRLHRCSQFRTQLHISRGRRSPHTSWTTRRPRKYSAAA
jgi:NADPH2:quinone reductase